MLYLPVHKSAYQLLIVAEVHISEQMRCTVVSYQQTGTLWWTLSVQQNFSDRRKDFLQIQTRAPGGFYSGGQSRGLGTKVPQRGPWVEPR